MRYATAPRCKANTSAPALSNIPEIDHAIAAARKHAIDSARIARKAVHCLCMLKSRHKWLGKHALQLGSIDGSCILLGLVERVQLRVQIALYGLNILGTLPCVLPLVAINHLYLHHGGCL